MSSVRPPIKRRSTSLATLRDGVTSVLRLGPSRLPAVQSATPVRFDSHGQPVATPICDDRELLLYIRLP